MSKLTPETVDHLTKLARIDCTDEEKTALLKNLNNIVDYFQQLEEIDTEEVPPCNHVLADIVSSGREDVVEEARLLDHKTFIENAPAALGGLIQVPPVIEG